MIKTDPKPYKNVQTFKGSIKLNKTYLYEVERTMIDAPVTDDFCPYEVKSLVVEGDPDYEIPFAVQDEIEGAIINHHKENGIGNVEAK